MICLNCSHMENMDYIHGTGVCGPLEGETVILNQECVCPAETIKFVESLQANRDEILYPGWKNK